MKIEGAGRHGGDEDMASRKLAPVGAGSQAGYVGTQALERPAMELLAEHSRLVTENLFDRTSSSDWARFFEIGARRQELPPGVLIPELVESGGSIVPTAGSAVPQAGIGRSAARESLRAAVRTMRQEMDVPRSGGMTRADKVRLAERMYPSGGGQPEDDLSYGR